jgi:hypothetical protein
VALNYKKKETPNGPAKDGRAAENEKDAHAP